MPSYDTGGHDLSLAFALLSAMDSGSPSGGPFLLSQLGLLHEVCQVTRGQSRSLMNNQMMHGQFGLIGIFARNMTLVRTENHSKVGRSRTNGR
jgi:hypothetical protein